jgi:hypothetical protein
VLVETFSAGALSSTRTQTWADGRVVAAESVDGDGVVTGTSTYVYDAASPSLDHEERMWFAASTSEVVWRRTYDPAGGLLTEDATLDGAPSQQTAQARDDDGRLIAREHRHTYSGQWSSWSSGWSYDADGLVLDDWVSTDVDDDGTNDSEVTRRWAWSCR